MIYRCAADEVSSGKRGLAPHFLSWTSARSSHAVTRVWLQRSVKCLKRCWQVSSLLAVAASAKLMPAAAAE